MSSDFFIDCSKLPERMVNTRRTPSRVLKLENNSPTKNGYANGDMNGTENGDVEMVVSLFF